MKIKLIAGIAFSLLLTSMSAQEKQNKIDAFVHNDSITHKEFRQILNLQFSKLVTGNTFSNIGNYASIKTTDKSLSLSASILNKKGNIISIEASGGATEGVTSFFNNGDLNTNISGKLTYHILINPFSNNTIKRNSFERDKLKDELQKAEDKYRTDTIAIYHKKELLDLRIKIDKAVTKKAVINDSLSTVLARHKTNPIQKLKFKIDSLLYEVDKIELDLILFDREKKKIENDEYFEAKLEKTEQKYDKAIIENDKKVINQAVEGISLFWFSIGYGIRNDGFKLFDSSLDFTNQVKKKEALTHQFNIAISHYNWESFSNKDTYWSAGASYKLGNNLTSLDNIKVKDFEEVSTNPNRESFSEQSVFAGDFENDLSELKVFFDYYRFFKISNTNSFAFHLNPIVLIRENNKPTSSIWTGIVLPFRKFDDTSSFLNLEIFYSFNDLFNTADSNDSLIGRNTIGLSATFPINFFKPKTD
ncbi:hypothetical protein [Kordia sp.]|uniref:hypothetical protein n=1 Tax=Kordia sp. TaxID=1965332 RepID=UPI003D2DCBEF